MKLLYYSPSSYGGIADYSHEQANALAEIGVEVDFLCASDYPAHRSIQYNLLTQLEAFNSESNSTLKLVKAWRFLRITLANYRKLADTIRQGNYQYVLLSSYAEYFSPLWTGQFRRFVKQGVVFGAVVHDPVRDFVLGPTWWHRWSIASAYSFLREAFVHASIELETVQHMPQLCTTVIPHGIYHFPPPLLSRKEMRVRLNLSQSSKVILAFGHLRANKNLDLVIQAMASVPDIYLVVAGSELSSNQSLASKYQTLAKELNVNERIRWEIRFIAMDEVGNFFNAADAIALTYGKTFRSASGVLNTAAQYRKFCIVSGGDSCLASAIKDYDLGIFTEPDDVGAIVTALNQWLSDSPQPDWSTYLRDNSWKKNAELTFSALNK